MRRATVESYVVSLCLFFVVLAFADSADCFYPQTKAPGENNARAKLRERRASALDLEVAGDLAGMPPGAIRYLRREDLLALPQVSYTITDDANFKGPTQVSGVSLEELAQHLSANPRANLVV